MLLSQKLEQAATECLKVKSVHHSIYNGLSVVWVGGFISFVVE